jgi:hypothetical protein
VLFRLAAWEKAGRDLAKEAGGAWRKLRVACLFILASVNHLWWHLSLEKRWRALCVLCAGRWGQSLWLVLRSREGEQPG